MGAFNGFLAYGRDGEAGKSDHNHKQLLSRQSYSTKWHITDSVGLQYQ